VTVLIDTSALYALADADDPAHGEAAGVMASVRSSGEDLLTHEYVLVETIALVQRRLGMAVLRRLLDDLLPVIDVAWVDPELHLEAREALLAAGRSGVSLVDLVSFLVMRRRAIRTAFAFDDDFAREGFDLLPAPSAGT
jgi:predicted nucleic acid-binding protein